MVDRLLLLRTLMLAAVLSACAAPVAGPRAAAPSPASAEAMQATRIRAPDWSGTEGNFRIVPTGIWGTGELVVAAGQEGVMRSEDRGKTWEHVDIQLAEAKVWGANEDDIYIAAHDLYRSRDRGKTWKRTALGTAERTIAAVWGTSGEDIWIAGSGGNLAHSKDHGLSFQSVKVGLSPNAIVQDVAGRGDEVWVAATEHADAFDDDTKPGKPILLRTKNHGKKWTRAHVPPMHPVVDATASLRNVCFTASGAIYASLGHRVWVSRDDAKTWTTAVAQDLIGTPAEVFSLTCRGDTIVAAGNYRQTRISRDDGATWTENEFDLLITTAPQLQSTWIQPTGELFIGAAADRWTKTMFRFGL